MKILLTGGCGYIGSHTMLDLLACGHKVICVDDLRNSSQKPLLAIEKRIKKKIAFYSIDICNSVKLQKVFQSNPDIDAVIHFAAEKYVNESTEHPIKYYHNNTIGLLNLLQCCEVYKVKYFVFSSSCSVYGTPEKLPVTEETPYQATESPYGLTKQIGEMILRDYVKYKPLAVSLLRYFNPAGAHPSGCIGEWAPKPQNLVPIIVKAAKEKKTISVFGSDYSTRDGSCIRDYIHVSDLARAHRLALEYMIKNMKISKQTGCDIIFNLGSGEGSTVMEVIKAFEQATKIKVKQKLVARRKGDVVAIYADYKKAKKLLGWKPEFSILDIMQSAWNFEQHKT